MEFIEGLTKFLTALAQVGFGAAAFFVGLAIFKIHPDIGKLVRRFARVEKTAELKRIVQRALDEDDQRVIDLMPDEAPPKRRKVGATPKLPAPVEP